MSFPIPAKDHPRDSRSAMRCAQVGSIRGAILWHPIGFGQRHPITEFHKTPCMATALTVGDRIKQARKLRGMTRPQLAAAADIKYPTLAGIENGDQASSTQIPAIAAALGVRPEWLQTGRKPMDALADLPSQPARLDPEIVAGSFKILRAAFEHKGKSYNPELDPDLFVFTYQFLQEQEGEASPGNLIDFGQRLAERMQAKEISNGGTGKDRRAG